MLELLAFHLVLQLSGNKAKHVLSTTQKALASSIIHTRLKASIVS